MSLKDKQILIGSRNTNNFKVVSGSKLVRTSNRVKGAMQVAKRKFERIEHEAKEDASKLLLNS